jgi:hypothetical protein
MLAYKDDVNEVLYICDLRGGLGVMYDFAWRF